MKKSMPGCADCPVPSGKRRCQIVDGTAPSFCPTVAAADTIQHSLNELEKEEIQHFFKESTRQEGAGYAGKELGYEKVYPIKPRIVETVEFARRMKYERLGLAFCIGLRREAKIISKLLQENGFEAFSAVCKAGCIPKEQLGIQDDEKIQPGTTESMCNPIAQAMLLNDAKTQFNIVVGLCVGHDSLFLQYAQAPCTVLAVKDRLLGHNPLAAVYTIESYYRRLQGGI